MPTITNLARVNIDYLSDDGNTYSVPQREAVRAKVGNVASTAQHPGRPARWVLRHIYLVTPQTGAVTNRKRAIIGDPTNPLFVGGTSAITALDGVDWRVEGRIGEKRVTP